MLMVRGGGLRRRHEYRGLAEMLVAITEPNMPAWPAFPASQMASSGSPGFANFKAQNQTGRATQIDDAPA